MIESSGSAVLSPGVITIDVAGRTVEAVATEYARRRRSGLMLRAASVATRRQLLVALDLGFDLLEGLFVDIAAIARRTRSVCQVAVGSSTRPMNRMLFVTLS